MSGNKQGGKRTAATNKALYGQDYYARIGAKGGRAKVKKGFAMKPYKHDRANLHDLQQTEAEANASE